MEQQRINELIREDTRHASYLAAAERWIENEMWNQRDRRPADLHDASAFCTGFNSGFRAGYEAAKVELGAMADSANTHLFQGPDGGRHIACEECGLTYEEHLREPYRRPNPAAKNV